MQHALLARSDELVDELFAADVIVIAAPMINFTIPSNLKAWIDYVARAGRTFRYSEKGPEGLVKGKQVIIVAARGGVYSQGPVNALDLALRKNFGKYQHEIDDLELADFKVRILNGGTEAITRVLIESTDSDGVRWWTVGVSENIIDASFQALMDSVIYKLMKNRHMAGRIAAE